MRNELTAELTIDQLHVLLHSIGQVEKDITGDFRVTHGTIPNQIKEHVRELRDFVVLGV
jgi:hypothetical protein